MYLLIQSQMRLSTFVPAVAFAWSRGHYYEEIKKLGCEVIDLNLKDDRNIFQAWRAKNSLKAYQIHHFHSPEITLMLASILCRDAVRVYTHRGGIIDFKFIKKIRHKIGGFYLRNFFSGLSGNTEHACKSASILFQIPSNLWRVMYNGVDFSLLIPKHPKNEVIQELQLPVDGAVTIGTSAQLRDWKRIDLLLEACTNLPRNSYRLLIVGDGPARQKLQELTSSLGIDEFTTFTGMKEHVGDYLALMDIFVLPSEAGESFGNAAVEAMSFGIPAIVFQDGGGLLEHIQNGRNGYIVSSVDELAKRLHSLIINKSLRNQLGLNAREFVTNRYTLEKMISSYDMLYLSAINNKKKKRDSLAGSLSD